MDVVIWNCSIGSFLSIQHTMDCQISRLSGRDMSVSMNPSSSSHVPSKRIDLLEDDIPISDFMDKFQSHIYKYIKHSHRSRWQDLEFKHSREFFELGTILSVVEFAEITHFLLRERYKVSIITPNRFPSSYMYCIDMLRRAFMVGIELLSHMM